MSSTSIDRELYNDKNVMVKPEIDNVEEEKSFVLEKPNFDKFEEDQASVPSNKHKNDKYGPSITSTTTKLTQLKKKRNQGKCS